MLSFYLTNQRADDSKKSILQNEKSQQIFYEV